MRRPHARGRGGLFLAAWTLPLALPSFSSWPLGGARCAAFEGGAHYPRPVPCDPAYDRSGRRFRGHTPLGRWVDKQGLDDRRSASIHSIADMGALDFAPTPDADPRGENRAMSFWMLVLAGIVGAVLGRVLARALRSREGRRHPTERGAKHSGSP